ncbi:MAG: hypothetical protein M1828_002259 [Chrysothrix sp. TS-e1954]|nr:MAG: hypothetical protein M1828_002259 [Chrysothrix sp. TS-e1954]
MNHFPLGRLSFFFTIGLQLLSTALVLVANLLCALAIFTTLYRQIETSPNMLSKCQSFPKPNENGTERLSALSNSTVAQPVQERQHRRASGRPLASQDWKDVTTAIQSDGIHAIKPSNSMKWTEIQIIDSMKVLITRFRLNCAYSASDPMCDRNCGPEGLKAIESWPENADNWSQAVRSNLLILSEKVDRQRRLLLGVPWQADLEDDDPDEYPITSRIYVSKSARAPLEWMYMGDLMDGSIFRNSVYHNIFLLGVRVMEAQRKLLTQYRTMPVMTMSTFTASTDDQTIAQIFDSCG